MYKITWLLDCLTGRLNKELLYIADAVPNKPCTMRYVKFIKEFMEVGKANCCNMKALLIFSVKVR